MICSSPRGFRGQSVYTQACFCHLGAGSEPGRSLPAAHLPWFISSCRLAVAPLDTACQAEGPLCESQLPSPCEQCPGQVEWGRGRVSRAGAPRAGHRGRVAVAVRPVALRGVDPVSALCEDQGSRASVSRRPQRRQPAGTLRCWLEGKTGVGSACSVHR